MPERYAPNRLTLKKPSVLSRSRIVRETNALAAGEFRVPAGVVSRAASSSAPTLCADIEQVRMCVAQFNRPLRQVRQLAGNLAHECKEFGARQLNSSDWEITVIFSFVPDATEWRSANALAAFSWRRSERRYAEGSGKSD